jgi:hypothetical protein
MVEALWRSLQDTQQLITEILPQIEPGEREINIT